MANPDLSKLSPEELLAEAMRLLGENAAITLERDGLRREVQSLQDRLKNAGGRDVHALRGELALAKRELATVKGEVEAEKGPSEGTEVCFQRPGEPFHRPGRVLSKGFTARVPTNEGMRLHAYIEIGEPPSVLYKDDDGNPYTPGHTFEIDRAYHPLGHPDTWHMPDECPHLGDPKKCPRPNVQPRRVDAAAALGQVQAP